MVLDTIQSTGNENLAPSAVKTYIIYNKTRYDLTPEEFSEYQRIVGKATQVGLSKISPRASVKVREKQISDVLEKAGETGRKEILRRRGVRYQVK
ncbi:MAG: hypothetical protein A4E53_02865 [Pelotomaculum sp. PtaB.Bin104]|nr:MAG: hypothetical protein A4E53_02865 [Pelotomaculum sp. PtaB.Bin104]